MNRRTLIGGVAARLATRPLPPMAQATAGLPRVGALLQPATAMSPTLRLLEPALRERGYSGGKDYVLEVRSSSGNPQALPALAAELVQRDVNVMLAVGPAAVEAAIGATHSIPIVAIDLE